MNELLLLAATSNPGDLKVWAYVGFVGLVVLFLALDLGVFHREAHEVSMREAVTWSVIWLACGLAFSGFVYLAYEKHWLGLGLNTAMYSTAEAIKGGAPLIVSGEVQGLEGAKQYLQVDEFAVRVELRIAAAASQGRHLRAPQLKAELARFAAHERQALLARQADARRRDGRLDRQFAPAAIDEHGELDARRPAEVVQLVEHGANRAPGEEDVVYEDDRPAFDTEWQLRRVGAGDEAARAEIVAVQRGRDHAVRAGKMQIALQPLGKPRAARPDADQHRIADQQPN